MTSTGFYFILNSRLKEDYEIKPGHYPNECVVSHEIDLYKYLVGIGNPGCSIDYRILESFYFIKYTLGEINFSELSNILNNLYSTSDIVMVIDSVVNRLCFFDPDYNYLLYSISTETDKLINFGNYYNIEKILKEENLNIELYDNHGYLVDSEQQLVKVKMMQDYLKLNRVSKDSIIRSGKNLKEHYR